MITLIHDYFDSQLPIHDCLDSRLLFHDYFDSRLLITFQVSMHKSPSAISNQRIEKIGMNDKVNKKRASKFSTAIKNKVKKVKKEVNGSKKLPGNNVEQFDQNNSFNGSENQKLPSVIKIDSD